MLYLVARAIRNAISREYDSQNGVRTDETSVWISSIRGVSHESLLGESRESLDLKRIARIDSGITATKYRSKFCAIWGSGKGVHATNREPYCPDGCNLLEFLWPTEVFTRDVCANDPWMSAGYPSWKLPLCADFSVLDIFAHVCGDPTVALHVSRYTCRSRFPRNPGVFQV